MDGDEEEKEEEEEEEEEDVKKIAVAAGIGREESNKHPELLYSIFQCTVQWQCSVQ